MSDPHTTPKREAEANMFAFELLMPEEEVRKRAKGKDLIDPKVVDELASQFGVESTVMAMRLGQLHMEAK